MNSDPSLHDEQLETEIRLVGDLVLAASEHDGQLPQEDIDDILGLDPTQEVGDARPGSDAVG